MNIYSELTKAAENVSLTQREGDAEKWGYYLSLDKAQQLAWRREQGHGEFCRLQRLNFHAFI